MGFGAGPAGAGKGVLCRCGERGWDGLAEYGLMRRGGALGQTFNWASVAADVVLRKGHAALDP